MCSLLTLLSLCKDGCVVLLVKGYIDHLYQLVFISQTRMLSHKKRRMGHLATKREYKTLTRVTERGDGVEYGWLHYLRGGSSSVWWASRRLPSHLPWSAARPGRRRRPARGGWLAWGGGASGGTGQWTLSHLGLITQWARAVEWGHEVGRMGWWARRQGLAW
jgi:hypothetical protein